jgi:transcription antitermination factor NusG
MEKKWYVIYTKPYHEKKVVELLIKKKIENYCPFHPPGRKRHGFKKGSKPLLSSYVFVKVDEHQHGELLGMKSVINLSY